VATWFLMAWTLMGLPTETTRFEAQAQGGVVVQVRLDGKGPFRFLLDTGSSHSAISRRTAAAIAARVVARAPMGSALGGRMLDVAQVRRLEVGPIVAEGLLPSVLPDNLPDDVDGVLGQDVLARRRFTIDYRRERIVWSNARDDGSGHARFAMEPRDGRFVIGVPQKEGLLWLVPDSGAATLLLFDDPGRPRPSLAAGAGRGVLHTLTARRDVATLTMSELQVGDIRLRDIPAIVVPRPQPPHSGGPAHDGPPHDGLLPLHLFERVTFDGPNRQFVVERE
jgi:predicted aspartyl protease